MSKTETVRLGYEVPGGAAVEIPIAHMVVTGQTQLSGKTTTLEALIWRSGRKAIAFVTKRGEGSFMPSVKSSLQGSAALLRPFFRQRADWQFVSDILGAILSEKLKWERSNIIKVCKGAKSLEEVHANVKKKLAGKIRGIDEAICTQLDAYFDLLLPEIAKLPYTDKLELSDGLNVMDLSEYSTALQMLVIAAVLDEIYKRYKGVVVVIPEAWEFVPNGKNSPVKSAAITLARKGAALQNFIWLDSQDLASIDTEVRRACSVWLLGVQREQNEVKRLLAHIPNAPKPKVEEVMHLELGRFFASYGRELHLTYVQPAWMEESTAQMIARGELITAPPRYAEEVSHVKTKPSIRLSDTPVAEWERFVFDPKHARPTDVSVGDPIVFRDSGREPLRHGDIDNPIPDDQIHFYNPADVNSYEQPPRGEPIGGEYQRIPSSVPYIIDDGAGQHYHDAITDAVAKEIDVDSQERHQYETQIVELKHMIYDLERALPTRNYAKGHTFDEWLVNNKGTPNPDVRSVGGCGEEASRGTGNDFPTKSRLDGLDRQTYNALIEEIIAEVLKRVPTAGTITLEPAKYVLKKFQQEEVARILASTDDRSVFQKRAIKFMEAKGVGVRTADLVTAVTGKRPQNMSRDCKDEYEELVELARMGLLRYETKNARYYPSLGATIQSRIAQFGATVDDVQQVIGQVILKLN